MNPDVFQSVLILTGPTGCGKTALGIALAERLGAEIVSMDSMALYRALDIGTAKPDARDRQRVQHHLIDVRDPWESASVAWWLQEAARCAADIERRGKRALLVGGTPLYLKAVLRGLFDGPPADVALRRRLSQEAASVGSQVLHQRLADIDPAAARRLHPNDLRRVIRALEVWELTGRPMSAWQQQWTDDKLPRAASSRCLCIDLPREELYDRINARVDQMLAAGLVEEVRRLRLLPQPISQEAAQALGYKEIFAHLDGQMTLAEAVTLIKTRSRNFAKRQLTWFRQLPECRQVT
ncbi:MAG TPA: tRNA (adenosine(37)-N6)-dimethylallyltransferase MiaA, partial [Gemmataceae bacterium]|nr:tRNA (adenosine(37)-N6)-dimethylallyltransferase MiaA [Gemmataceae bacterium]